MLKRIAVLLAALLLLSLSPALSEEALPADAQQFLREQAALWLGYDAETLAQIEIVKDEESSDLYLFLCPEEDAFRQLKHSQFHLESEPVPGRFKLGISHSYSTSLVEGMPDLSVPREVDISKELGEMYAYFEEAYPFLLSEECITFPYRSGALTPDTPINLWVYSAYFPSTSNSPLAGYFIELYWDLYYNDVGCVQLTPFS